MTCRSREKYFLDILIKVPKYTRITAPPEFRNPRWRWGPRSGLASLVPGLGDALGVVGFIKKYTRLIRNANVCKC